MKKGILYKEGKTWKIKSEHLKTPMPVMGNFGLTDDLNNLEVEFDNQGGPVKQIRCQGKDYRKIEKNPQVTGERQNQPQGQHQNRHGNWQGSNRTAQQHNRPQQTRQHQSGNYAPREVAHAPYNFVPINDVIVDAKKYSAKSIIPPFDSFAEEHHSGYIDLEIEAKTKVFIGSGSSVTGNYIFFAPNGIPSIPGSSLRGMVRTMVEICSWGQFKFFENKQLFYRTFGTNHYRTRMVKESGQPVAKAGYLIKAGREYKIIPALCNSTLCNTEFYRVNFDKSSKYINNIGTLGPFNDEEVFFKPTDIKKHKHKRKNYKGEVEEYYLKYAEINSVNTHQDNDHTTKGTLIVSGDIHRKKHMHWVINLPDKADPSQYKNVSKDLIDTYRSDASRSIKDFDLLSRLKKQKEVEVPCFYLEENGKITAIGHTPYFRLPYKNKIGDLLPAEHKKSKGIDIPTAIFGNESTDDEDSGFAGRVFFEDAVCKSDCDNEQAKSYQGENTDISPKPTSFQLYIRQESTNVTKKHLKHYDSEGAELRGNKLYWHKTPRNNTEKLQFNNTRIRFTNLNSVELGALLFALDLPEGCCHKIGMGKPQGLGSINITPKLHITDHQKKYASFTAAMHYKSEPEEDITSLKETFENYIKVHPGIDKTLSSLWHHDRLKQLKKILDYDKNKRPADSKTNYMGNYSAFADRKVLPDATDVK